MKPIFIYESKIPKFLSIFISVYGITLYPFIIFRDKQEKIPKRTINHELIHIRQQKELFIVVFYFLYVYYWIKNLIFLKSSSKAYYKIPFEIEAYENDENEKYLDERLSHSWTKYRKLSKPCISCKHGTCCCSKEEFCDACECDPCDCEDLM